MITLYILEHLYTGALYTGTLMTLIYWDRGSSSLVDWFWTWDQQPIRLFFFCACVYVIQIAKTFSKAIYNSVTHLIIYFKRYFIKQCSLTRTDPEIHQFAPSPQHNIHIIVQYVTRIQQKEKVAMHQNGRQCHNDRFKWLFDLLPTSPVCMLLWSLPTSPVCMLS